MLHIVHGLLVGIHTVFVRNHFPSLTFRQEIQSQVEYTLLFLVVGHTANVPLVALALRYDSIFAYLSGQRNGFIGWDRNTSHELSTILFAIVQSRVVAQHLKTGFEQYEQSHLISTGTDTTTVVMLRKVKFRLVCQDNARSIVHWTYGITHERIEYAIVRDTSTILFYASHAFVRKDIRILVFQTGRLERTVEIHEQMMLGCFSCYTFVVVHHPLVATVHEVNLHTLHAPFFELREEVEIVFYTQPSEPKDHAYILFLTITDQFLQVEIVVRSVWVISALCPTFVQQDVLHTVLGCKIQVILISFSIATSHEIYISAIRSSTVPPFPSSETRLDPRRICNLALFSQTGGHGIFNQLTVFLRDDKVTPWETTFARSLGNIVCMLHEFQTTVAIFSEFNRILRESRREALVGCRSQEHVRIIRYSRFADKNLVVVVCFKQHRENAYTLLVFPFAILRMFVVQFIISTEIARTLEVHLIVCREIHLEDFVHYFHFALLVGDEAISHTVIECTEFYRIITTEFQQKLVVMIADVREFERNHRTDCFIHRLGRCLAYLWVFAKHLLAQLQLHDTIFQQGFLSVSDVIINLV